MLLAQDLSRPSVPVFIDQAEYARYRTARAAAINRGETIDEARTGYDVRTQMWVVMVVDD
jgi:hypothetical protein